MTLLDHISLAQSGFFPRFVHLICVPLVRGHFLIVVELNIENMRDLCYVQLMILFCGLYHVPGKIFIHVDDICSCIDEFYNFLCLQVIQKETYSSPDCSFVVYSFCHMSYGWSSSEGSPLSFHKFLLLSYIFSEAL